MQFIDQLATEVPNLKTQSTLLITNKRFHSNQAFGMQTEHLNMHQNYYLKIT